MALIHVNSDETAWWCHWKEKVIFTGLEEAWLCTLHHIPHGRWDFQNQIIKGLRVVLIKERPLYLPSNWEQLDFAYISATFASSAASQTDVRGTGWYADLCKWSCHGVCGGETVATGRGMRLKRAMGSRRTFSTHNSLWCLFTHCGGLWVVWGKARHLLSLFCKACHGHCGISWWHPDI